MLYMITKQRLCGMLLVGVLLMMALGGAAAQDEATRVLTPNTPIDGTIDATNVAQVYTFSATAGDEIGLTLTPQSGVALTMVVTDESGNNVTQVIGDGTAPDLLLETFQIAETGNYYVTVFPSAGVDALIAGSFILTLNAEDTPIVEATPEPDETPTTDEDDVVVFQPGRQVVLNNGIQVTLRWETVDDLNLQIRDPSGGTLFWDSRTTTDGGTFDLDANGLCENLTALPQETAAWPGGAVAVGSYEILIYYRQACEGNNPVDFTVDVSVDGELLDPIAGTILPPVGDQANVYVARFSIDEGGSAFTHPGGPYIDERDLDVPGTELVSEEAEPIILGQPLTGAITNQSPYETFSFEGLAGQIITISLTAASGSLDTLVLVLDSAGNVIAVNDDIVPAENTNSQITNLILPAESVYTVVATRYGKSLAGTEGNFELIVGDSGIPAELLNLDLPSGDIEVTLTWETNADLQLLVRDPSGNSVYDDVPSVPSGGRLTAQGNVNCTTTEGSPVSYIYWPEGFLRIGSYEVEVWYQSECNDTRDVFFTIYIVVEGNLIFTENVNLQFNERYLTSFNIDQTGQASPSEFGGGIIGGSETLDYASELPSAVTITSGQAISGSITAQDKFDVYTFAGQAGDLVTIDLRATSATLDTLLFLLDPNGIEIASNDDANETTNSVIFEQLLSEDGQYTIIATHYGTVYGGTTGGYNLSLRIDN